MAEIIVIAAVAQNNAIGKDGDIPWRLSEDFQHFQKKTMGHPCVMGDKTYESLPDNAKPLPGRENIVLTFDKSYNPPGTKIFFSWDDAMEYLKGKEKVYICGGASIYRLGLKVADTLELTRIHKDIDGDTFFPEINFDEWELVKKEDSEGINKKNKELLKFSFLTYRRKK
ncbi:dihydrofolate reductase [Candidatus Woesearchaeota archaeon]|nr:dihydrofolate reductase [Candidatus Woesearchaeota archaeon]